VCWCVRLRLFLSQGEESVIEAPFQLGSVPAARTGDPGAAEDQPDPDANNVP
jgi:hypothetical protein